MSYVPFSSVPFSSVPVSEVKTVEPHFPTDTLTHMFLMKDDLSYDGILIHVDGQEDAVAQTESAVSISLHALRYSGFIFPIPQVQKTVFHLSYGKKMFFFLRFQGFWDQWDTPTEGNIKLITSLNMVSISNGQDVRSSGEDLPVVVGYDEERKAIGVKLIVRVIEPLIFTGPPGMTTFTFCFVPKKASLQVHLRKRSSQLIPAYELNKTVEQFHMLSSVVSKGSCIVIV